jgi:hypothetical protein
MRTTLYAAWVAAAIALGGCARPFLGPGDYFGSYTPRLHPALNGAQATYAGALVVTMLDRSLVAPVLPPGLHLATPKATSIQHPVIFLVGVQGDPLYLINGALFPSWVDPYDELILLIPFVVGDGGSDRWHNYAVRMYLDALGPVVIGDVGYGYAKELALLVPSGTLPDVNTRVFSWIDGMPYFASTIVPTGAWRSAAGATTSLPRWVDLQKIFEMPIVGSEIPGLFICSYFEWEYSNADVAAVVSVYRYLHPFKTGVGMDNWVNLGPLANAPDGAVALRGLRWRLSLERPPCVF